MKREIFWITKTAFFTFKEYKIIQKAKKNKHFSVVWKFFMGENFPEEIITGNL